MAYVVKCSTETETSRETESNGHTKETIVTKTTEILSDGTKQVKTNTETRFLPKTETGRQDNFPTAQGKDQNDKFPLKCSDFGLSRGSGTGARPNVADKAQPVAEFLQDALTAHNNLRRAHGAPAMVLDAKMNKFAQEWAQHLAATNMLQHRPRTQSSYGENVFCCSGMVPTGQYVVDNWYSEVNRYNFNNPGYSSGTGHFSQVVWKGSSRLGMGRATSNSGSTFVVANYDPAGNINTQQHFRENVFPKGK